MAVSEGYLAAMVGELLKVGQSLGHLLVYTLQRVATVSHVERAELELSLLVRWCQAHRLSSEDVVKITRVSLGGHLRLEGRWNLGGEEDI